VTSFPHPHTEIFFQSRSFIWMFWWILVHIFCISCWKDSTDVRMGCKCIIFL